MAIPLTRTAELKDILLSTKDVNAFLTEAWESSIKNSAARNYMAGLIDSLRWAGRISSEEHDAAYDTFVTGKGKNMNASMIDALAKTARVLCEDEQPNSDSVLQAIVGDPADTRMSTFVQFKPNPGTMQLPNPLSPIEGDEIFFAYMIPGAIFQAHDGTEWWIESYASSDQIEITNRWYPRLGGIVSINDIRRSIHQWIEPVTQTVPPPPPGIDYGALPVKIVDGPERYGAGDEITDYKKNDNTGGW
jgi:hypothetical protein